MYRKQKRVWLALGLLLVLGLLWAGLATAGPVKTLRFKSITYPVKTQYIPALDSRRHIMGLNRREGKAVFADGQVAKYVNATVFDMQVRRSAQVWGYTTLSFKDGSFIYVKWSSRALYDPNGRGFTQGLGKIIKGGGRFKGIQGAVSFYGGLSKPLKRDPKREAVVNAVMRYRLP